jgi:hypothetical protein
MSKRKHGRSLLGLLVVAALGVMAFAASAQALTPKYLIAKVAVPEALKATVTGALEAGTVGTLLIPALNSEINCTAFKVQEGLIDTGTDAKGKLLYENCTVAAISPLEALPCHIVVNHEIGEKADKRLHITATALILPAELTDNVTPALLAENIEAKVLMEEGTGCPLPKTTLIKGELCLKIAAGTNDTAAPLIFSEKTEKVDTQAECKPRTALNGGTEIDVSKLTKAEIEAREKAVPPTLFLDELLFGTQKAFVDGKAILSLTGEKHIGKTLGVSLQ